MTTAHCGAESGCSKCRVSKTKLVAYNGKLIRVEEAQPGESPNGSGFVITTKAAPQLDATNLVVGHVTDGMDIVEQLTQLPTVKSNNSVFFRCVARVSFCVRLFAHPLCVQLNACCVLSPLNHAAAVADGLATSSVATPLSCCVSTSSVEVCTFCCAVP